MSAGSGLERDVYNARLEANAAEISRLGKQQREHRAATKTTQSYDIKSTVGEERFYVNGLVRDQRWLRVCPHAGSLVYVRTRTWKRTYSHTFTHTAMHTAQHLSNSLSERANAVGLTLPCTVYRQLPPSYYEDTVTFRASALLADRALRTLNKVVST